ncbi:MAG TPA: STAS domain-containing protein, partial [Variovorax sp.]|nr:STAS domain-containing protein [Variovorax sp.]
HKVGRVLRIEHGTRDEGRTATYDVVGQVFFASSHRFAAAFDFKAGVDRVRIDLSRAHFWDLTAIDALDKVVTTFRRAGCAVDVSGLSGLSGMSEAGSTLVERFAVHDEPRAIHRPLH